MLATLAATAAIAACTKEVTPDKANTDSASQSAEGSRVIAVSFAPQTKTYLDKDGLQPKFNDGDSVLISNGKAIDTCEVSVDGDCFGSDFFIRVNPNIKWNPASDCDFSCRIAF